MAKYKCENCANHDETKEEGKIYCKVYKKEFVQDDFCKYHEDEE